jgi:acyl-CoA dehydrogenase
MTAAGQAAALAAAGARVADRDAAFPAPAIACLGTSGLLAAAVPADLGGLGCDLETLVGIARVLARGCGSTAMIWAMHQVQVACVARHGGPGRPLRDMLARLADDCSLIASVTSEEGVGGSIRVSQAAVRAEGTSRSLDKRATTVSYGNHAGAFLVTARRSAAADENDQVAILIDRAQARLETTGIWDPMGMRGTASPAMRLRAVFAADQILPDAFADVAAATMLPLSHLLWSAVWTGLAAEAFERARRLTRTRRGPAGRPETRLAQADEVLSGIEARLGSAVACYEPYYRDGGSPNMRHLVQYNALKAAVSEDAVRVAVLALDISGIAGYQEDGDYTVARLLRDLYSARVMVANDRLRAANALNLLTIRRA